HTRFSRDWSSDVCSSDLGIPTAVIDQVEDLVCGYHLALLKPVHAVVDSVFLSKQLAHSDSARYFSRYAAGSTRYGLSNKAIANRSEERRVGKEWRNRWAP